MSVAKEKFLLHEQIACFGSAGSLMVQRLFDGRGSKQNPIVGCAGRIIEQQYIEAYNKPWHHRMFPQQHNNTPIE